MASEVASRIHSRVDANRGRVTFEDEADLGGFHSGRKLWIHEKTRHEYLLTFNERLDLVLGGPGIPAGSITGNVKLAKSRFVSVSRLGLELLREKQK